MKHLLITTCCALALSFSGWVAAESPEDQISSDNVSSEKQHKKGKKRFKRLDKNSDGHITLEEFRQSRLPYGEHDTVFSKIDSDGDGKVTRQELKKHAREHKKKREKRQEKRNSEGQD